MRKILREFDQIWKKANQVNQAMSGQRFYRCYNQTGKYISFGLYDSMSKKHVILDTINLAGNYRYPMNRLPPEIQEMRDLINS